MLVQTFTGRTGEIVGRTPEHTPLPAQRVFVRLTDVRIDGDAPVVAVFRYHPDDVRPLHTAPLAGVRG